MRPFYCIFCLLITLLMMGCGTSDDTDSSTTQNTDESGDATQSVGDSGNQASDAVVEVSDADETLAADSSEGPALDSVDDGATSLDDGESQSSDAATESTDAATESTDVVQTMTGGLALKQLGSMRDLRGAAYAPVAFTAYSQGMHSEPGFTCVESIDAAGNSVLTYTFTQAYMEGQANTLSGEVRVETYNTEGHFLSWVWEDGPSYICDYADDIACTWTDLEGAVCVDHFDLTGAFIDTDCDTVPGEGMSCEQQIDGGFHCTLVSDFLTCEDWYTADETFEKGGCVGAGMLTNLGPLSDCALQGDVITCSVNAISELCEVELDLLLNVLSRTCEEVVYCSWGIEECDSTLDACTCAWRTQVRTLLCEMGNLDPATQIDEPDTTGLLYIQLYDDTPEDGGIAEVFINTDESWFYVRMTGSALVVPADVGPYYYGPFDIEKPDC
jgi:hypothetical protein